MVMFHQLLGFPAIICCTGELCNTPLFMPFLVSTISTEEKRKMLFQSKEFQSVGGLSRGNTTTTAWYCF